MELPDLPNGGRYTGYWRVSTDDQNPDMQIAAMVKAGVPEDRIRGDVMTGSKMDRPGLKSAMRITRDQDVLVVWKLDRLGRSLIGVLDTIKTLEQSEIGLISLTDAIDTTSVMGRAMMQITMVFAEMERNLIAERTKAGMAAARARGSAIGRPIKLRPDEIDEAVHAIRGGDMTISAAAVAFNVSRATLYRAIRRRGPPNLATAGENR